MEAVHSKQYNYSLESFIKTFRIPKVTEKLANLLLEREIDERVYDFVRNIEKNIGYSFVGEYFDKMAEIIKNDLIYEILKNTYIKLIMNKDPISEETILVGLTPWIVDTGIAKIRVSTSKNPTKYLQELWEEIKK